MVPDYSEEKNCRQKLRFPIEFYFLGLFILFISFFYFLKLGQVPFHPDESTQIFMSGDLEEFFENPAGLIWKQNIPVESRMNYRMLDAPLARELIGVLRMVASYNALPVDWNWSKSWQENKEAGALPSGGLLVVSRMASAIFFPFDLFFLYLIGRKFRGKSLGWIMVVLFSVNALVLLHTRRAMSEGSLVFFIILSIWCILQNPKYLILIAIPAAFAFNAKYSAFPLFLLGLFTIVFRNWGILQNLKKIILHSIAFILVFLLITYILNPFLWGNPVQSIVVAIQARQELLIRQVTELGDIKPGWILDSPIKRFAGLFVNLFLAPPAFYDVGNYIQETSASELKYLLSPFASLFRGYIGGSIFLLLAVSGFLFGIFGYREISNDRKQYLVILAVGTILQSIFLLLAFPFPFQRYIIPLVPFSIIWVALAVDVLINSIKTKTIRIA